MPKRTNKTKRSRTNRGAAPQWSTADRLSYHLAECAMHLATIEQLLSEEAESVHVETILNHRVQAGKRLKVMYKLCRIIYPDMLKQPGL